MQNLFFCVLMGYVQEHGVKLGCTVEQDQTACHLIF